MLRVSLGLLTGQFAVYSISSVPYGFLALVVTLFIVGCWLPRLRLMVATAAIGSVIALFCVQQLHRHQWPADLRSTDVTLSGLVDGLPTQSDTGLRLFLSDITSTSDAQPRRIRLNWHRPTQIPQAGERWQFTVRLKRPAGLGNPGSFDVQRYSFITQVDATGYVRSPASAKRLNTARGFSINRIRQSIAEQIKAASSGPTVPLVLGLSLGISAGISDVQWQILRDTGTVHLLAISGLHIGLIATFAYVLAACLWALCSPLQTRCSKPAFAIIFGFICATVYAALAGFSLPTQRALIMLFIVGIGLLTRRASIASFALCTAAVLITAFDPTAVLSVGFTMSFAAVALLIYLGQGRQHSGSKWFGAMRLQWQLSLLMLPLSAWFFGSGSLVSPLANLVAVPFVGLLIVPLCIITALLVFVSPTLSAFTLQFAELLLKWLMIGLQGVANVPGSHVALPVSSQSVLLVALLAVAVMVAPLGLRLRRWSWVLLLPIALYLHQLPAVRQLEVHVLDVGQGLSVAVFTKNHTLLFDTGGRFGDSTMMERVVDPFLATRRRGRIDTAVISHADEDHAAGLDYLIESQAQLQVFASDSDVGSVCKAGEAWQWDGVWFAFVHPSEYEVGSRNDRSCVLLIHYGETRFLLTGDIESSAEATLIERGFELPITVMTAPHHGSATSSSAEFLQIVKPQHIVIPAGRDNRHGHPHADVVKRYEEIGSRLWMTGEDGAVSFNVGRDGVLGDVGTYWGEVDKPWR
ncbi:MAG: DNA internalization-related competence protein ComEC/Rec2 [Granulosicoccaceae bacterium]